LEWQLAVDVYAKALKRYPKNAHLKRNAVAIWDSWAKQHISAKQWAQAIEVYGKAGAQFPGNSHLKNNLKYCKQKQAS
jgi:tetratricopeptide (TPR) repeat protein